MYYKQVETGALVQADTAPIRNIDKYIELTADEYEAEKLKIELELKAQAEKTDE